ncbi:MAG: sodium:solute symporter family protein, partial [Gammaproteobacteria bacterium]|nr:sodium:solute symporter family protein [Gammaproteobacteria bacterium]
NRSNTNASDWAIGGGSLGVFMLAAGVAGTRIGGAGTYGVAGDVISEGIGHLWYGVNSFAALFLVGLFFVIPYRRLKVVSVGQVFDHRFGSYRCQWLTSLCVQAEYLIVNIIEPYVIGSIISGVTGLPFVVGVAIGGFLIISFTVTGGLKGTAVANVVHCTVIIFGLLLVGMVAMNNIGGWEAVVTQTEEMLAAANKNEVRWWSFTGIGWATIIALFIAATIHTPAASVYANYASSAAKQDYLIPGFFFAGIVAALMPLVAGFIGILTMATYGSESGLSSYLNIAQLAIDTGPILGGIALAAVLAAVISSGAPILLASATMFVNDWVPGSKNFSSEQQLRAYKIVTVIYGSVAAIIAWLGNISSVLQLLLLGFAMVVPPAIAVTYVFYWRRTSEVAAFCGMAAGFVGGLTMWLFNTLYAGVENATAGGFAQWWYELIEYLGEWRDPSFLTLLLPLITIPVLTLLMPNKEADQQRYDEFYTKLGRIQPNFSWK